MKQTLYATVLLTVLAMLSPRAFTQYANYASYEKRMGYVDRQFNFIARHGDPIGFRLGVGDDPSTCMHYQSIARVDGPDKTPYFIVTRSGNITPSCPLSDSGPGEILVVKLDSRERNGERLRTNRVDPNRSYEDTPAPPQDRGIVSIKLDGQNGWPNYFHPGGCQVIGDVLVVPLEGPRDAQQANSALLLVDVSNPEQPTLIKTEGFPLSSLGVAGVTFDRAAQEFVFIMTQDDGSLIRFYRSTTSDLRDPNLSIVSINDQYIANDGISLADPAVKSKWMNWQNMQFVRQVNGELFLVCSANSGFIAPFINGSDFIRLFKVEKGFGSSGKEWKVTSYIRERHLDLTDPDMGNLSAGGGVYISLTGQLIFYTIEYDNSGPDGTVLCGEYRSYSAPPSNRGWVEFYEHDNGWNNNGRSLIFDGAEAGDSWNDLGGDGWENWGDEISSIHWDLPPGVGVSIWEHDNYGGDKFGLSGRGIIPNLEEWLDDWGDRISCCSMNGFPTSNTYVAEPGPLAAELGVGAKLALAAVDNDYNTVIAKPGNYPNALKIDQQVTLRAEAGGLVIIGR